MLEQIKDKLKNIVTDKKSMLLIFITFILLLAASYVFKTYLYPRLNPKYVSNKEFIKENEEDETSSNTSAPESAKMFYFYTEWCPYCKTARPEWDAIKEKYNDQIINNKKLQLVEIDCESKVNADLVKNHSIDGYPTIKMVLDDGKTVEYDSKPSQKTLELFIHSVLK